MYHKFETERFPEICVCPLIHPVSNQFHQSPIVSKYYGLYFWHINTLLWNVVNFF